MTGTFWQVETPENIVQGELTLADGSPTLEVVGQLFVERANKVEFGANGLMRGFARGGRPHDRVLDWLPRNIQGRLDDGTLVSMVGAQGKMKPPHDFRDFRYRQEFRTLRHAILNEHVDDRTTYSACRFRVTGPIWYTQSQDAASTADGGVVTVTHEGDSCLIEFVPADPMTMKELGERVLSPARTLASIVSANPTGTTDLHVRLVAESPWRKVFEDDESTSRGRHELLDSTHLTAERFARWIDFRAVSGALDAAAIDSGHTTIQTEVLTLAAVAEGLHRRLFDKKKRVPALSRGDLKHARESARTAAIASLQGLDRSDRDALTDTDLTAISDAIGQAMASVNEVTFKTRMSDLVGMAQAAIPDIVNEFADWPDAVKFARNMLVHQGTQPPGEPLDQFHDLLIALGYSIAWVLRTVLLVHAGLDGNTLRNAYGNFSRYTHHIANVKDVLSGSQYAAYGDTG
ncbi:hypothetical protein C6A86_001400 [Mycobacterium sp. ITM-2016-00316]|uniref:HEPN domain-containing protein n=1 Tax=Mycobacterium sp. ITM-2016-00316 TaxID=2099695 RepID=UPI001E3A8085|nr:HEPN domain-containing protein [Mycobacterium sp. ITM-2016-00316]WNG82392.1 hypothetical protein C6A86_001400 [Mycobacterium sp. ITM-2016-00316]